MSSAKSQAFSSSLKCVKARAKHSPFAKNADLAIIGERISGSTKILAKDFQLVGKK